MFDNITKYLRSDSVWLLLAMVIEIILILALYIYNRRRRTKDFDRLYEELLRRHQTGHREQLHGDNLTRGELQMISEVEGLEKELYKLYSDFVRYDDMWGWVSRITASQKKMQDEFEKMNLLLSSTGVYNNLSTSQCGIQATKLLEQIAKMTNVDFLLDLLKDNKERKFIVMENVIKDISHTIKTPISGIYAILLTLNDYGISDPKVLEYLKDIEKSLDQIEDNLQAYRDLMSRTLDDQKKSAVSFVERLTARLKVAVISSDKRLYIDSNGVDAIDVDGNLSSLILLALDCIIENATYFANDNSTIRVKGKEEGEYYSFQIENDGHPISEDNAKKIFEDGFSTHSSSGKGLFFVKSVIRDRLGGDVDFENIKEPVPGVRFIILLDKNKLVSQEREKENHGKSNDSRG